MERTRKSLYVPATYLLSGGLLLLFAPDLGLKLMLSNGEYGTVMPRFVGLLTAGLGMIVVQIIRHKLQPLYVTVIWVRAFFCSCYVWLYFASRDPIFLLLLGMVGFGMTLTAVQYVRERKA